jgi:hypothetical protein
MQFNSLRSRGNYANAGRAAANNALRLFLAARRSSPDYGQLAQKGALLRSADKKAMMKIKSELTKRKIAVDTDLKVNQITADALAGAKADKRKAGLIAAAGQSAGIGMMKLGEKPVERRDSSEDLAYFDKQIEKLKADMAEMNDGNSTSNTSTDSNNTGDQQGSNQPGKVLETPKIGEVSTATNVSTFNPNISDLDRQKLDIIGKYESDPVGGYNAINQIGIAGGRGVLGYSGDIRKMKQHGGRALTDFTVGEIMDLQADPGKSMSNDQWIQSGKLHAVGRYQFIGPTFRSEVQRQGIDLNAKFTPQLQDKLALGYLNHVGSVSPWVGPSDKASREELRILNTF